MTSPHRSRVQPIAALLALAAALLPGCRARTAALPAPLDPVVAIAPAPRPAGRTVALVINGGGRKQSNYQSHLHHVKELIALLSEGGMPAADITVFSGDGADPAPDLATRDVTPGGMFWLLPEAGPAAALRPQVDYVDSSVEGFALRPARRPELEEWFKTAAGQLHAGDTLLLYVTDHGERNKEDLADNTITLWSDKLSVGQLRDMLAPLDPQVRVVMFMSQCFSGSFANAIYPTGDPFLPAGNVCGYFASTADRPAYGCYPENRGVDGVGHSHHMFEAAEALGNLREAHRRVLVTDDSPDVPHTSADFFLTRLLEAEAARRDVSLNALADELIAEAWTHKADWEPEIRLIDRIGQTFGTFSPRSLAELEKQSAVLPAVSAQLRTYSDRWHEALAALAYENMQRFLEANANWRKRLEPARLKVLTAAERRTAADELLADLLPYTERDRERYARLQVLRQRADDAGSASYRMEVRLGVVLRMRMLLLSIAGREYLARHGSAAARTAYGELLGCQDLALLPVAHETSAAALPAPPSFPPLIEDQQIVNAVMPAWMGIRYRPLQDAERKKAQAPRGAVVVITVYPDSPASTAGLRVGDLILGPPGHPFEEPNQVREWTMRSEIGEAYPLDVLRQDKPQRVTLRPGPYPMAMPELPGPPKVGSAAPPLDVELVRGATALASGKPRLLFFWATWCLPCKAALPEVLAFAAARGAEVVAVTDEPRETLEPFFKQFTEPFPAIVATDRFRVTFQNYGVSGTPTFVLIDAAGTVQHYQTGYAPKVGLKIDGWHWEKEPKKLTSQ